MTKAYLVMEKSYEYNDEGYSSAGGGEPQRVFTTMEKAEELIDQLYFTRFKQGIVFNDYISCAITDLVRDHSTSEEVRTEFNSIVPEMYAVAGGGRNNLYQVGSEITFEQSKQLTELFGDLDLFYVQEVDIEV